MSNDRKEESQEQEIEGDDEDFEREMGISREALHELEMCPFVDELTRLNHEPLAVIEAEYLAEQARRNGDPKRVLEALYRVELAQLNHSWAPLVPGRCLISPPKIDWSKGGPANAGDRDQPDVGG